MNTYTINPERLAELDKITLAEGVHAFREDGMCSMEAVAFLADLGHTDAPPCTSPVLTRYVIRLNDRWDAEQRQTLKPYLPRLVGTSTDGLDPIRERIALLHVADLTVPWLKLAGLTREAEAVTAAGSDVAAIRESLWDARDAAWAIRSAKRAEIEANARERHTGNAAADDVAAAAGAAVAAGPVDAAADAAAAGVAVADVAVAVSGNIWTVAYHDARDYHRANPLPIAQEVADLAAKQQSAALDLLDRLIDAREVSA